MPITTPLKKISKKKRIAMLKRMNKKGRKKLSDRRTNDYWVTYGLLYKNQGSRYYSYWPLAPLTPEDIALEEYIRNLSLIPAWKAKRNKKARIEWANKNK